MKIATWNVNSVRARQARVLAWLTKHQPDVVCLQEIKVEAAGFPGKVIEELGYTCSVFGQKSYNGVAILSRTPATDVSTGFGDGGDETQSRVIAATIGGVRVVNLYVPNGNTVESDKYVYKLAWLARLRTYLAARNKAHPWVVVGDMNVAPDDRDVYDPAAWAGAVLCSQPEREGLASSFVDFEDVYRKHHSEGGVYSWWDFRTAGFFKNHGLRIDHILVTEPLRAGVKACTIDKAQRKLERPSDHAPVMVEIELA